MNVSSQDSGQTKKRPASAGRLIVPTRIQAIIQVLVLTLAGKARHDVPGRAQFTTVLTRPVTCHGRYTTTEFKVSVHPWYVNPHLA